MQNNRNIKLTLKQKSLVILLFFLITSTIWPLILYYYSVKVVRDSIIEKNTSQAEFFVEAIDSQILTTEEMTHNILFDRKLSYLIVPNNILSDYELMQSFLSQQERLKHLMLSSPLVEEATIYLPNIEQKITGNEVSIMNEEDKETVKELNKGPNNRVVYSKGQLYMVTSGMYYTPGKTAPDLLFVIRFSPSVLKNYLNNYNVYPDSFSFFKLENEDTFFGNDEVELNKTLRNLEKKEKVVPKKIIERNIKIESNNYRLFSIPSEYFGTFYHIVPEKIIFEQTNFINYILVIYLFLMVLLAVIFSVSLNRQIHQPLNKLVNLFRSMEEGNLEVENLNHLSTGSEFDYVFNSFNDMKARLKELIDEVYIKESLVQLANLKQLQSQINPHFLYNSFFSLSRKIKRGDNDSAALLAEHLGTYFRFLGRPGSDTTTLEKEVIHARSYTNIQEMRFSDRISVDFESLPSEYNKIAVPRLILQPIIENAFKYGLENLEYNGLLSVRFIKNVNEFIIQVDDNGQDLSDEVISELNLKLQEPNMNEMSGLLNIHKRLMIFFGDKSGLSVQRNPQGGLRVRIHLSILTHKNKNLGENR